MTDQDIEYLLHNSVHVTEIFSSGRKTTDKQTKKYFNPTISWQKIILKKIHCKHETFFSINSFSCHLSRPCISCDQPFNCHVTYALSANLVLKKNHNLLNFKISVFVFDNSSIFPFLISRLPDFLNRSAFLRYPMHK